MMCPRTVRKVLARLKYSVLLYKAGSGFSILAEECLTFQTTWREVVLLLSRVTNYIAAIYLQNTSF